eukprot:TRINITY_DN6120_c0_g1_i3.p1 TRINITY_DN6120_c0_g1~~TRINITY_DN6120_c0_g1_i3.p1  ORF type:complete len:360 (-),score=103.07 TRINITY_DN6120_c0_g1_i3:17-1096(-)
MLTVFATGAVSFVLLVIASWCVGEGGEILGKKYDASVIGGLIIAWLNTAPEAIFFITALHSNNPRFAVGAVSGSSIVVCTVALGICLFFGARAREPRSIVLQPAVKSQCQILLASLIVPIGIVVGGFTIAAGITGIVFYCWFIYQSIRNSNQESKAASPASNPETNVELGDDLEEDEEHEGEVNVMKGAGYLIMGGLLIVIFSTPFIQSMVDAASILQVNPILLAFFLAPIASEAPEIMESISLSRKGNNNNINIAISNLVGGTVTKTTLLCGIFCFFGLQRGFSWESPEYTLSISLLIFCAGSAGAIGIFFPQLKKFHGIFLLVIFGLVGIVQFMTNTQFDSELFVDEGFGHDDLHTQ